MVVLVKLEMDGFNRHFRVKSTRFHNGLLMEVEDGFKEESYESDLQK